MKRFFSLVLAALCLSTQAYADKVTASTTLPTNGKPEHVYTMVSGNGAYVSPTTTPVEGDVANGLFAFYAVDGVNGAYYIYSHNAKKWLTYDKKSSYPTGTDFVKLSDSKVEGTYFKLDNYADDFYQISPYTTYGTAQAIYLNYFGGVSACSGKTLGLWTDNGSKDGGSSYTFAEYVIAERTYTISVPEGVTLKISGVEYADGSTITVEGSVDKSKIQVVAPEGKFAVVSVNDVENTITVNVATLPTLPACEPYANAWVYPKQQDNVGAANISEDNGVYVLNNKVLAAGFMKVGDALYFAGCEAMDLVAGTEPFTVAFGNGDNVPASAMTLKSVKTETLAAQPTAIGGAEHFAGVALVANYEYTYKGSKVEILWRAVLRDGSHYLRTEMELKGVNDVDMFNIIPMIYNVDTQAAGSTPKVVGNTRGATIVSDKIFAGLETPTAYNTVGEATGEEDKWELVSTNSVSLTAASWTQVAENDVPKRVEEATGANYPYVRAYKMTNVALKKNQKVEIEVKYTTGAHRLNFGGADLLASNGDIAANDYHSGYSGGQHSNNTFTFTVPNDGTYSIRVMVEDKSESIDASSTMTVKIYNAKEGAVINTDIVGIQGRWSRNTTLAAGETWKVGAVVGLVAQDGTQDDSNIRNTQKRRSFLAYSERERAVPWRAFPCYISWYELNINRNNAAPGLEYTNFTSEQVLDVLSQWKTNFFDKYGEGPAAFVIDDGWDNYGTWTFHKEFPNQMRDMAAAAKKMGAGVGAWLGPVGGYGQSGNYRRAYWSSKGGMQLSNPEYYKVFKDAAYNLVCNQDGQNGFNRDTDNYMFFKFDGISAQFSAVGPDAGDVGNENAEGIIRLERYVREELREDIFFNTTVGTWASPFWYQISDATWRQENDHGRTGDNSINRENWITYRDRLVYQNYVSNSPLCPINTLMTHGFILTKYGPPADDSRDYNTVLRELRCAFLCGSGMVELYNDYSLMNEINGGQLWKDLAECIAWQKKNADVLPDAHWVGGNPWTGSKSEIYGWASWNGAKATLALRNASNSQQTYTFTLRQALEIPANITGKIVLKKSFKVQDDLNGLTIGSSIDIDKELTVTLPGSSVFAFDGINAADYVDGWENEYDEMEKEEDEENESVSYTVNMSTGKLANYSSGTQGNWNYKWSFTPTAEKPVALTIAASNNANNIAPDGDNIKFFAGSANRCTYVISVPEGYVIESYSFGYVTSGNNAVTITPEGGNAVTSSKTKATLSINNINKRTAEFTLSGGNYGFSSSDFVVNIKEGMKFTEVGNPTEDGVYRIYWKQNNRGYLAYHDSYPTKGVLADVTLGSYGSMHFNSATDPVELEWYLITSEKGNKYLFSAYNGKFLSYSEESADAAKAAYLDAARPLSITIANNTSYSGYYIIKANVDGRDCLLSSGCGTSSRTGYPIRWNSNISGDMGDGGSPLIFVKVSGLEVDADILARAQAAIEDYENPVEENVNFAWTTSTPWQTIEPAYYTSTVLNDNALDGGIKYIEGEVTIGGARTATVTFTFTGGSHKLNIRGVEVIDELGNIVAGDYHVGTAGGSHIDNTYTVSVAEAGTYKVRCYATEGNGDQFNQSNGSIVVSFAKLNVMELTKEVTFAAEYSTLYLGYKVAIPSGVEAYVLSGVNATWATLTPINNVIPANTAVILKGVAGSTYNFYYVSDDAEEVELNYLEGSIADRYIIGDAYVLGIPEGKTEPALCKAVLNKLDKTAFKNNANKAYFKVAPGAALSASLRFDIDGTTGIDEVKGESGEVKTIYDLTGRRVESIAAPGIYIINGKKAFVK